MANFTNYSYDELVEKITRNLQDKENWGDAYNSSTAQTLIQIIADASDQLAYMLERRTQENYITTARLQSSIYALANQLNYRPRRKVSSTGTLRIRLVDGDGNTISPEGTIEIPRYTRIFYQDDVFVNTEDVLIEPDDTEVEFQVMEGRPISETFEPNDLINNSYILFKNNYSSIENSSLFINDDDDFQWFDVRREYDDSQPVEALSFADRNERYYDIIIANDGLRIVFGNNEFGRRPDTTLYFEWIKSSGNDVNIDTTGLVFQLEQNELTDDINVTPANTYEYEIINTTKISGGLDEESIEDVRIKAPEFFKTGNRAVTRNDYDHLVIQSGIGGIVDSNTYGEQESGVTIYNMNNVYVSYLKQDGSDLLNQEKEELRKFIDNFKMVGTHVVLEPVDEVLAQINLRFSKNQRLRTSNNELYDYVRNQLIKYFEFKEGSINKPIYYSELVEFLQTLKITRDGVSQSVAKYLTLDINALTPFESPIETQKIDVEISAGTDGDDYTVTIDGSNYTYTQTSGDTANIIASNLASNIDGSSIVSATATDNVITVESIDNETTFVIENKNSTNTDNVYIEQEIQIPPYILNNQNDIDLVVRNSVQVVDVNNNIIHEDDGSGNIGNGTINYKTALIKINELPEGQYYVRYKHDDYDNIYANERSVVGFLEPKLDFTGTDETLSTIEIEN